MEEEVNKCLNEEEKDREMVRGRKKKEEEEKTQMTISRKSVSPLCPSLWCHSPTASLPIKALIKTDKVSPNEERAVGGLNC